MKEQISVVVPVYQVVKYLPRCMEGLLAQTYPNYEIILVDDGSTDGSGELCDRYAAAHDNVIAVHQENQGPGPARNHGVRKARAEYIAFVDSDDSVTVDYLEYMWHLISSYRTPMAVIGGTCIWDSAKTVEVTCTFPAEKEGKLDRASALELMCYGRAVWVAPWGKIYRRELLEKYPFPAYLHEDLAVMYKIIGSCQWIAAAQKKAYYYYQNADSIMTGKIEERHLYGMEVAKQELKDLSSECPEVVSAAEYRCALKIVEYIPRLLDRSGDSKKIFKKLQREMKPYLGSVFQNKKAGKIFKIRCFAVTMGYTPTLFTWKIIHRIKQAVGKEGI